MPRSPSGPGTSPHIRVMDWWRFAAAAGVSAAERVTESASAVTRTGSGPDTAATGTPPPNWIASIGEPVPLRPMSRLSQPTRASEPGSASSTSSIAEKWERFGAGSPVAWTAAILPLVHHGSSGDSAGCRPKKPSLASSLVGRHGDRGPGRVVDRVAVRDDQAEAVAGAAHGQHHQHAVDRRRGVRRRGEGAAVDGGDGGGAAEHGRRPQEARADPVAGELVTAGLVRVIGSCAPGCRGGWSGAPASPTSRGSG